jgi:hypothetical protein
MTVTVAGRLDRTIADLVHSCLVHIEEEQQRPNPNTALIAVLCDTVRLANEHVNLLGTNCLTLDLARIRATNLAKGFTTPSGYTMDQKLLLVIEELVEANHHRRLGHALDRLTFSAKTGWWCTAHHDPACQKSVCQLKREEFRTGQEDPSNWEHYELSSPEGFGIEIIDAIIRLADILYAVIPNAQQLLNLKMDYNAQRPMHHGERKF